MILKYANGYQNTRDLLEGRHCGAFLRRLLLILTFDLGEF